MREAKFVATVFGTVTACLIGGLAVASAAAPNLSSREIIEIAESASEEPTIAATVTSVSTATEKSKTTAQTTTASTTTAEAEKEIFIPDETISFDGITFEGVKLDVASSETVNGTTYTVVTTTAATTTTTAAPATTTTKETTTTTTTTTTAAPAETTTAAAATTTEPTAKPVDVPSDNGGLPISESDFILLCNAVGHEAGSNWISDYDKACVVEVIMNRVNSPLYPNTILGVLTQPYQFSGAQSYVYLGTYSSKVTESVKNAVRLYFNDPSQFSQGYLSFWGDGRKNYFR